MINNKNQQYRLSGCAQGLKIANIAEDAQKPVIVITPGQACATRLYYELRFFLCDTPLNVQLFPDWETLPYDSLSPHNDITSTRLSILAHLPTMSEGIIIVTMRALMNRLAPVAYIKGNTFQLACGDTLNINTLRHRLQAQGYRMTEQVLEHGEISVRGAIIDLFPMGSQHPFRIELFDDTVDTIRSFNPETQCSIEKIDQISLLPAKEFPLDAEHISTFRSQWRALFEGNPKKCSIYQDISEGLSPPGAEYYLPLFFETTAGFFDYLPHDMTLVRYGDNQEAGIAHWQEIQQRFEQLSHNTLRPVLAPDKLFVNVQYCFNQMNAHPQIIIKSDNKKIMPDLCIDNKSKQPLKKLAALVEKAHQRILICAETAGRREVLLTLMKTNTLSPALVDHWPAFLGSHEKFAITVYPLDEGMINDDIILISEAQLFGERVVQRRKRKKATTTADIDIKNLAELNIGDPIVHMEQGIGRYLGLKTMTIGDHVDEYLELEYADSKLFVPVSNLHLISRYGGTDPDNVPLHKLGSDRWARAKRKAQEKIRDVAAELLDIYARRGTKQGHAFVLDKNDYQLFANDFPFEETPDQEKAIDHVLTDMQASTMMDRLICGDVGFGKTEVAMRAAFLAVMNNKQVTLLAPTTLLVQQHYQTFCDRFAAFPVNIGLLSRFVSTANQKTTLEKLATGNVDILIGTHALLGRNVNFKNLGLLIIDEEHRFGVRQKERLKSMRAEVDILTMTATPIPRTLNMAFVGIRDLSIIATPPARRLAIKTFVHRREKGIIREAILREIFRGGQVFFLHNNVATINNVANELQTLVPEARISIGHGQMKERELEQTMSDFYHRKFNVLLCTTIIETGIDIPTANTMIIDRADRFGLAQLHQLRGRVGRSHHQAYAYLLINDPKTITKNAEKRLDAIAAYEDLGMGFMLATHDLEIRGTGELLGQEQSGHIQAIGFTLYMEMLNRAIQSLKDGKTLNTDIPLNAGPEINLGISAIIPEDYLGDVHLRLMLYKRISGTNNKKGLDDIYVEITDRFGLLPDSTKNLLAIQALKQAAKKLGIEKIDRSGDYARFHFNKKPTVDFEKLLTLVNLHPVAYRLSGPTTLGIKIKKEDNIISRLMAVIQKIAPDGCVIPIAPQDATF
jgi:transcription-repair coupling factor (superfamily II helicase)